MRQRDLPELRWCAYGPNAATAHIWVEDSGYIQMPEFIRIYNADAPEQYTDIGLALEQGLGAEFFCGNSTSPNVARFTIQPGTTLHWKARNASKTRYWEGTLRNPNCMDGTDCYSAWISNP